MLHNDLRKLHFVLHLEVFVCVLALVLLSIVCFGRAAECILLCMSFFYLGLMQCYFYLMVYKKHASS